MGRERGIDSRVGERKTSPSAAQPCLGCMVARCGHLKCGRVKRGRTKSYSQTGQVVKGYTQKESAVVELKSRGGQFENPRPGDHKHPSLTLHSLTVRLPTTHLCHSTTVHCHTKPATRSLALHHYPPNHYPSSPAPLLPFPLPRLTQNPIWLLPVKETL